jgi:hypothetical protein
MVVIYLGRQLGGHRHEEIGKTVGLGKTSSVSSTYLLMKERVAKEKPLQQRVRKIEEALTKSGVDPLIPDLDTRIRPRGLLPHDEATVMAGLVLVRLKHRTEIHQRNRAILFGLYEGQVAARQGNTHSKQLCPA